MVKLQRPHNSRMHANCLPDSGSGSESSLDSDWGSAGLALPALPMTVSSWSMCSVSAKLGISAAACTRTEAGTEPSRRLHQRRQHCTAAAPDEFKVAGHLFGVVIGAHALQLLITNDHGSDLTDSVDTMHVPHASHNQHVTQPKVCFTPRVHCSIQQGPRTTKKQFSKIEIELVISWYA